jgi:hypothetical protein
MMLDEIEIMGTRVRTHKAALGEGASDVCFSPNSGAKADVA